MKTFTASYQASINKNVSTITGCMKVVRKDGTTYLYTEHDRDIVVNTGQDYDGTYTATYSFIPSAFSFSSDLSVDNFDITNVIDNLTIKEIDVINKLFLGAEIWYFTVDYSHSEITATEGINKVFYGNIGQISYTDETYTAEARSLSTKLTKSTGEVFSKTCRTTLGSTKCGIILNPDVWVLSTDYIEGDIVKASVYDERRYICTTAGTSGITEPTWNTTLDGTTADNTVVWTAKDSYTKEFQVESVVTDRREFVFTLGSYSANQFQYGLVTWTSGNNNGFMQEIKTNTTDTVELFLPTNYNIQTGDTFEMSTGCNRLMIGSDGTTATGDCKTKYNNIVNFRGEVYIPSEDLLVGGNGPIDKEDE